MRNAGRGRGGKTAVEREPAGGKGYGRAHFSRAEVSARLKLKIRKLDRALAMALRLSYSPRRAAKLLRG